MPVVTPAVTSRSQGPQSSTLDDEDDDDDDDDDDDVVDELGPLSRSRKAPSTEQLEPSLAELVYHWSDVALRHQLHAAPANMSEVPRPPPPNPRRSPLRRSRVRPCRRLMLTQRPTVTPPDGFVNLATVHRMAAASTVTTVTAVTTVTTVTSTTISRRHHVSSGGARGQVAAQAGADVL